MTVRTPPALPAPFLSSAKRPYTLDDDDSFVYDAQALLTISLSAVGRRPVSLSPPSIRRDGYGM